MTTITWPTTLLVPADVKLSLQTASRGGGQTIDGNEQVVASPASQRWAVTFANIAIRTAQQILAWRAIEAQADGRTNVLLVPAYDWSRSPVRSPLPDGQTFSDDAVFAPDTASIVTTAAAAVNATSLAVSWSGPAPLPGQHFSIGNALYRVASMAATGAASATLTIRPWLRAAVANDVSLNFDTPVCPVRLVKDDGLALNLTAWRFGTPSVDFIEAT